MKERHAHDEGLSMVIHEGEHQGVAVDKLVDDLLHDKTQDVLADLYQPHDEVDPETDA